MSKSFFDGSEIVESSVCHRRSSMGLVSELKGLVGWFEPIGQPSSRHRQIRGFQFRISNTYPHTHTYMHGWFDDEQREEPNNEKRRDGYSGDC